MAHFRVFFVEFMLVRLKHLQSLQDPSGILPRW
jgi:hypothetical protein